MDKVISGIIVVLLVISSLAGSSQPVGDNGENRWV